MTARLNEIPEHVIKRQVGYFPSYELAMAYIREQLFKRIKSWVEVNKRMSMHQYGPYKVYIDQEYDEEDGSLISDNGVIVYI